VIDTDKYKITAIHTKDDIFIRISDKQDATDEYYLMSIDRNTGEFYRTESIPKRFGLGKRLEEI